MPARNQNRLGADGQPVEVARIKHGIPTSKLQHVAEAIISLYEILSSNKYVYTHNARSLPEFRIALRVTVSGNPDLGGNIAGGAIIS